MSLLPTWNNALTTAGLLALLACGSLQVQATEAKPTQAEKEAIAAEKTAPGSVTNAVFTTAVMGGEPTEFLSEIQNSVPEVFFFTVIDGMAGQTITHRWKYKGEVMAKAAIEVKRDHDKVWSSNKMKPEWTGPWEVEVVDGSGRIINRSSFAFEAPL